jgi:acetolactate synthase-1/2/3 large subunit
VSDSGNAGELVALALKRAGVTHLFTLNGGHIWPILTGATEHGIRIVDVRHEQSAAFAAEGWAKITRQCGVAAVTAGPGVTNSTSALAQALANDSPLFVIGGRAPIARWGMGSLQEMDHLEVVRSLTKRAITLGSADEAYAAAAECVRTALSRRTGPVFMDIPIDVFFGGHLAHAPVSRVLQQVGDARRDAANQQQLVTLGQQLFAADRVVEALQAQAVHGFSCALAQRGGVGRSA